MRALTSESLPNENENKSGLGGSSATLVLCVFCAFLSFYKLGQPALFEPDEGRNAEVAREILLSKDWVTPQYNFVPRLDKPIFAYWILALSYKVFGVSEWSARLPSVLTGAGSVFLTCKLAGTFFGVSAGLWSGLVLATSLEPFLLSRTVIPDAILAFFITLSLCAFVWWEREGSRSRKSFFWLLMYAAMAGGTLIKGPIGIVVPGAVIFFHLLLTRNWRVLRQCHPLLGFLFCFILVAPWYAAAELRNPGYLRYFFVEEHLLRFLTADFNRSEPWYTYLGVLAIGFFPWTTLIPQTVKNLWRGLLGKEESLFLVLWAVLPVVLYSFSASKLPHYILPIYPPLSILAGESIGLFVKNPSPTRRGGLLSLPWLAVISLVLILLVISSSPGVLPDRIQGRFEKISPKIPQAFLFLVVTTSILVALAFRTSLSARQAFAYGLTCLGFVPVFFLIVEIASQASFFRSSRAIVEGSSRFVSSDTQVVLYEAYLSSLPFYLRITRPIWVVWSGKGSRVMGSVYVAEKQPEPARGFGRALFLPEEFCSLWRESSQRFVVFIHERDVHDFHRRCGGLPMTLLREGDVVLITNR